MSTGICPRYLKSFAPVASIVWIRAILSDKFFQAAKVHKLRIPWTKKKDDRSHPFSLTIKIFTLWLPSALYNTGFLTRQITEIVNSRSADDAAFHDLDVGNHGGGEGEHSLDADAAGDFAHGERLVHAVALDLQYHALELLDTLLGTFNDSVGDVDGVASLNFGNSWVVIKLSSTYWINSFFIALSFYSSDIYC